MYAMTGDSWINVTMIVTNSVLCIVRTFVPPMLVQETISKFVCLKLYSKQNYEKTHAFKNIRLDLLCGNVYRNI